MDITMTSEDLCASCQHPRSAHATSTACQGGGTLKCACTMFVNFTLAIPTNLPLYVYPDPQAERRGAWVELAKAVIPNMLIDEDMPRRVAGIVSKLLDERDRYFQPVTLPLSLGAWQPCPKCGALRDTTAQGDPSSSYFHTCSAEEDGEKAK